MNDATRERLAHCLNYHDTGSPLEADVQALWRAYQALEAERDGMVTHLEEGMRMILALQAERAQVAPVLAVCRTYTDRHRFADQEIVEAIEAYDAGRAAREG